MPPMPYHLEKGPLWSVLEDFASASQARLVDLLTKLRNGDDLATIGGLDSPNLDTKTSKYQDRVEHVKRDWFGWKKDNAGAWVEQQDSDFDPLFHPETGFWQNYFGNVEAILRATLIRTCEVALGLDHDAPIRPTRFWPVSFFLRCPTPWFEGWVTWRADSSDPRGPGHVVTHVHTPAHTSPVQPSPLSPPNRSGPSYPDYVKEPTSCVGRYGMWIVTAALHEPNPAVVGFLDGGYVAQTHRLLPDADPVNHQFEVFHVNGRLDNTTIGTPVGIWLFPTLGMVWKADTQIVTVQPCEADGGVLPAGRAY